MASLLNVAVLGVGYYFLIKLYREWVGQLLRAMLGVAGRPPELPTGSTAPRFCGTNERDQRIEG